MSYVSGSECGDTETLMNIAQILVKEPFEYRKLLQQNLRTGIEFSCCKKQCFDPLHARKSHFRA